VLLLQGLKPNNCEDLLLQSSKSYGFSCIWSKSTRQNSIVAKEVKDKRPRGSRAMVDWDIGELHGINNQHEY
jgi:hypothetical protein